MVKGRHSLCLIVVTNKYLLVSSAALFVNEKEGCPSLTQFPTLIGNLATSDQSQGIDRTLFSNNAPELYTWYF